MTSGVVEARILGVYIEGTRVGCTTNGTITFNADEREVTCDDSGIWRARKVGLLSASVSFSGLFAEDATGQTFHELWALWLARAPVEIKWSTEVSGDSAYSGDFILTELSMEKGETGGNVSYSGSAMSDGPITKAVISA